MQLSLALKHASVTRRGTDHPCTEADNLRRMHWCPAGPYPVTDWHPPGGKRPARGVVWAAVHHRAPRCSGCQSCLRRLFFFLPNASIFHLHPLPSLFTTPFLDAVTSSAFFVLTGIIHCCGLPFYLIPPCVLCCLRQPFATGHHHRPSPTND